MNELRKLKRSTENKMIAGVCGGFAEYFQVDASLVRIIWALTCFGGAGIVAYVICLLIMPVGEE